MPNESTPETEQPKLDLSLIHLPTVVENDNVEVALSSRPSLKHRIKRNFWSQLALRVDLTGPQSPVKIMPIGTGHDRPLSCEVRIEKLYERLAEIENANVLLDDAKTRPLNLYRRVSTMVEEVQPQFFLRNITRLERDVSVRRLSIRFAVWREDHTDDFEGLRYPEREPVEMLEEFSAETMHKARLELQKNVNGFVWHEVLLGYYPKTMKIHPYFWEAERVSVYDLSLKPAPPYRYSPEARTNYIMNQLGKRTDGTADD